jgi:hypothetical protein
MQGLASEELLGDLAVEREAVGSMLSCHGSSSENPAPRSIPELPTCPAPGAHSIRGSTLHADLQSGSESMVFWRIATSSPAIAIVLVIETATTANVGRTALMIGSIHQHIGCAGPRRSRWRCSRRSPESARGSERRCLSSSRGRREIPDCLASLTIERNKGLPGAAEHEIPSIPTCCRVRESAPDPEALRLQRAHDRHHRFRCTPPGHSHGFLLQRPGQYPAQRHEWQFP